MAAPLIPATAGSNLAERLANRKTAPATAAGTGLQFVKFNFRNGEYTVGREELDITGDEFLVNTESIGHGYICWPTGQRPQKKFVPFDHDLPPQPDDIGDKPWEEGRVMQLADLEDGTMMQIEGNTYGLRQGVDALTDEITARYLQTNDASTLYPVVKLGSRSYVHPTHGTKIHNPIFEVVGWSDRDGNVVRLGDESKRIASDAKEAAPGKAKSNGKAKPAPKAEAEADAEEAPVRRRRRV